MTEEIAMGLIRMHNKNAIHFVTNRCEQEQFLMLPVKTINKIIGYWFARALCRYGEGLEIFAFIFLSNHFHMLARDTKGTLSQFMGYFQGNVAKAINEELGRHGKFWPREYDDMLVDSESDDDFLNRFTYILCNSVKAGLTTKATDWIGWNSIQASLKGEKFSFTGENKTKKHKVTRRIKNVSKSEYTETYEFALTPPLMWLKLSIEERAKMVRSQIKNGEAEFKKARGNLPALGIEAIKKQKWYDRPMTVSKRPRIKIYASNNERKIELLEQYRAFVGIYRDTYNVFKIAIYQGKRPSIQWPDWSFPPSVQRPVYPNMEQTGS